MATLAVSSSGCPAGSTRQPGEGVFLQPPLVRHRKIFTQAQGVPLPPIFDGSPLLGFSHMVAPTNKNESPQVKNTENTPLQRFILQLLGGGHAPPRWDLVCILCSGKFWRGEKFRLPPSQTFSLKPPASLDTTVPSDFYGRY